MVVMVSGASGLLGRAIAGSYLAEGHVWTAPGCQALTTVIAAVVEAAMCSACECGSHGRWP